MKKFKEWWKKLSYWRKVLTITLVVVVLNSTMFGGSLAIIFYPLNKFLFEFINLFNLNLAHCGESCWGIAILIGDIEFIVFILLLSVTIKLIRKRRK